jgi:dolichol-phosphate mannosyltransferase
MPQHPSLSLFSVIIPARDEEESLPSTLAEIVHAFDAEGIPHEIVVVDDGSRDRTWEVLQELRTWYPSLAPTRNTGESGFGRAVIWGLEHSRGDAVVIMMADSSDSPADAVKYWRMLNQGYDCAFGSRFISGSQVVDYPRLKLFVNRVANFLVRIGFNLRLNDTTNAFKAYRRAVIDGCRPFLAPHFNLTVELPLKAIVRGYSYAITPISWRNRRYGEAKLKLKEMGSRYFFICACVWLEKFFSRGDYCRRDRAPVPLPLRVFRA